jgi:AcrR family transcriptional regulator
MVSGHRGRGPRKRDKREAILQASWELIRHHGYSKVTIADIAREAGVGKGTAYLYFRSKRDIMLALVDQTNRKITDELERIARSDKPPGERLHECLLHRVLRIWDLVHKYKHGHEVITSLKPDIVARVEEHVRDQGEILARLLREGRYALEDPDRTGQVLAGLFELLTPPYYRFRSRRSLQKFATHVADLVLRGASAPEEKSDESVAQVT